LSRIRVQNVLLFGWTVLESEKKNTSANCANVDYNFFALRGMWRCGSKSKYNTITHEFCCYMHMCCYTQFENPVLFNSDTNIDQWYGYWPVIPILTGDVNIYQWYRYFRKSCRSISNCLKRKTRLKIWTVSNGTNL
jgi:hypothetical protein